MVLTNNADILNEILEDSASNGGANNANGTLIKSSELTQVVDRVLVGSSKLEARYRAEIKAEGDFSNPPTATEVQAVVDDVNLNLANLFKGDRTNNNNFNYVTSWDVSGVTNMNGMFNGATRFNQNISDWDVSNVTNMGQMFNEAYSFNRDLSSWDVSNVTNMSSMFAFSSMNQDLSGWDISALQNATNMFLYSDISMGNFDKLLAGWATLDTAAGETAINNNVAFGGRSYTDATSYNHLVTVYGWDIDFASRARGVTAGTNGDNTLGRSTNNNSVNIHALDGNDTVIGGRGNDIFVGGRGDDVLTGGTGADRFVYRFYGSMTGDTDETGHDTITDFDPGNGDVLDFSGLSYSRFADILVNISQDGDDVVIALDDYNSVRLEGMALDDIRPDHFLYGIPPLISDVTGSVTDGSTPVVTGKIDIDEPGGKVDGDFTWAISAAARYGSASIDGNGDWTYTLNTDDLTVQRLQAGETLATSFTARTRDAAGAMEDTIVNITIKGGNNAAVINGIIDGTVIENYYDTADGSLTSSDIDGNDNVFKAATVQGAYGDVTMNAAGHWTYSLDTNNAGVQNLSGTNRLQDIVPIEAEDGTIQNITITIYPEDIANFIITDGDDTLNGTVLGDRIEAAKGDDLLFGNAGDDTLYGYEDDDTIWGGVGDDLLYGYYGQDLIYGEDGHDRLYGGPDADTLYGGTGDDFIQGVHGADVIEGGDGDDSLLGGIGEDSLNGGFGEDTLYGGDGNDTLNGLYGDDTIFGEAGNNRLLGHAGHDYIEGGDGDDTVNGGAGDDYIVGNGGDDQLAGGNDNDTLHGGEGHDKLYGNAGDDSLAGGNTGNDTIEGGTGHDTLHGGTAGRNLLSGGDDNDKITGGASIDTIDGGDGDDTIDGGGGADTITGDAGHDYIDGGDGHDWIDGGAGHDTIFGGDGTHYNNLYGGDGNDLINASSGNYDALYGGSGDDTLISRNGGNDYLTGDDGHDSLTASGNGNFELHGGIGHDTLISHDGDDTLAGGLGNDNVISGKGDDVLRGGSGADTLDAGDGDDNIKGDDGQDSLMAGSGDDTINGGRGNDTIFGSNGADTFVFSPVSGDDKIMDFDIFEGDVIDLSNTNAGYSSIEDLVDNSIAVGGNKGGLWIDLGNGNSLYLHDYARYFLISLIGDDTYEDSFVF